MPVARAASGPGDKVEVTVRPEKIDLHRGVPADGRYRRQCVAGVVTEVVYHGTSHNYTVSTAARSRLTVFDQNASSAEDLADRGDRVYLTWDPQHSYPIGSLNVRVELSARTPPLARGLTQRRFEPP